MLHRERKSLKYRLTYLGRKIYIHCLKKEIQLD